MALQEGRAVDAFACLWEGAAALLADRVTAITEQRPCWKILASCSDKGLHTGDAGLALPLGDVFRQLEIPLAGHVPVRPAKPSRILPKTSWTMWPPM